MSRGAVEHGRRSSQHVRLHTAHADWAERLRWPTLRGHPFWSSLLCSPQPSRLCSPQPCWLCSAYLVLLEYSLTFVMNPGTWPRPSPASVGAFRAFPYACLSGRGHGRVDVRACVGPGGARFSLLSLNWGVGLLLGPAIGGVLSSPVSKYPSLFPPDGLFGRFAFLLPCLVLSAFSFISILFIIFMLPETLGRAKALGAKGAKDGTAKGQAAALENGQATEGGLSEPLLQGQAQGQGRAVVAQRQSSAIQVVGSAGRSIPNDALGLAAGSYESVRSQSISSPSAWLLLREGEGAPKLTRKASGAQLATAGVTAEGAAAAAYAASVAAKEEARGSSGDLRGLGNSSHGGSSRRSAAGLPVSLASGPEPSEEAEENVSVWSALTESDTSEPTPSEHGFYALHKHMLPCADLQ